MNRNDHGSRQRGPHGIERRVQVNAAQPDARRALSLALAVEGHHGDGVQKPLRALVRRGLQPRCERSPCGPEDLLPLIERVRRHDQTPLVPRQVLDVEVEEVSRFERCGLLQ